MNKKKQTFLNWDKKRQVIGKNVAIFDWEYSAPREGQKIPCIQICVIMRCYVPCSNELISILGNLLPNLVVEFYFLVQLLTARCVGEGEELALHNVGRYNSFLARGKFVVC